MQFETKTCEQCGKERKFRVGAANYESSICGNCFDWEAKV